MLFFTPKMSQKEKIDFLEYISFQLKSKSGFEKATVRYISSGAKRTAIVVESCNLVIELIKNGSNPALSLYEGGFLDEQEYSLILNSMGSESLDASIKLIVELKNSSTKSSDVLKRSLNTGIFFLLGLFSLIPLFRGSIVELYEMFANMSSMATGEKQAVQLPFLVEHWWSIYVIFALLGVFYFSVKFFINWLYVHKGDIYYKVFRYRIYIDLIAVLEILRQMSLSMSMNNAYRALSKTAPSHYWREFFEEIDSTLKKGGKASEVFSANGAIPVDVVYALIDAEDTGEANNYLSKAVEFCVEKNNDFQDKVRVGIPMMFELLMFFVVGLIAVKFVGDMNNLGILNVVSQIGK